MPSDRATGKELKKQLFMRKQTFLKPNTRDGPEGLGEVDSENAAWIIKVNKDEEEFK